jgi:lipopolysaccharide transport system permease protein
MSTGVRGFELTGKPTPTRELLRDIWESRRLLEMLARRDFFVRYRRAALGMAWAVILPAFQATILALIFTNVVKIKTVAPYPVFIFPAYLAWGFFAGTMPAGASAIVDGAALSNKIYFPRAMLPLVSVASSLYNFFFSICTIIAVTIVFSAWPGWRLLLLVPATVLLVALTAAFALFFSGIHVYFRDLRYIIGALTSPWLFVTPVVYPLSRARGLVRILIMVNPMTGIIELFHASTTGEEHGWLPTVGTSVAWIVVALVGALAIHRRFNRVFSDLL